MEHSEPAERHQRPELDRDRPARLFSYAKDKLRYLRERVNEHHLPSSVEHLSEELEQYISMTFDSLPPVTVVSDDIFYTKDMMRQGSRYVMEIERLPMSGDAELTQMHTVNGLLYGFHKGESDDLRAYVSINDGIRKGMGGIYTPLLSVGVEHSDIKFTEISAEEELEKLGVQITELLQHYGKETKMDVSDLLRHLNDPKSMPAKKLHEVSPVLAKIARYDEASPHLIDMLFEYIKYRLRFTFPQDIHATAYREVQPTSRVPSYNPRHEPKNFTNVVPELALIGESANRSLGLLFINDDKAVQIPVQYITSIQRTQI